MAFLHKLFTSTAFFDLGFFARIRHLFGIGPKKLPVQESQRPVSVPNKVPLQSILSSTPQRKMHSSSAQMVAARIPLIKFIGARLPRPNFNRSNLPPLQIAGTPVAAPPAKATSIGPVGKIPRGQGIPESQLPQRFRRQPISQEECDAINISDGAVDVGTADSTLFIMDSSSSGIVFIDSDDGATQSSSSEVHVILDRFLTVATSSAALGDVNDAASDVNSIILDRGGPKTLNKEMAKDGNIKRATKAIEATSDDLVLNVLCSLFESYVATVKGSVRTKRLRKLCKADVTTALIRTIRSRLRDEDRSTNVDLTTERLALILMSVGVKDPKLTLKIRVAGLLTQLCHTIFTGTLPVHSTVLIRLFCRALRSPRNAQLAGRQRGLVTRLISRLTECTQAGVDDPVASLDNTSRLLEISYFLAKNKKTRTMLVNEHATPAVYKIFEENLNARAMSLRHQREEVCLMAIALLRILVNNKRAKDDLISLGAVSTCERTIREITSEKPEDRSELTLQLQDSLCALCLRCMPLTPFPLSANVTFPLKMILPSIRRRSTSKSDRSLLKERQSTTEKLDDGDAVSSDEENEDEEDDVFTVLHRDKESEQEMGNSEDDAGVEETERPISFSKQKLSDLKDNYEHAFAEFHVGEQRPVDVTDDPEYYEELLKKYTQTTSSVVPFVKIAYPELCNPDADLEMQRLLNTGGSMKELVVSELARTRPIAPFEKRVVYSLDDLVLEEKNVSSPPKRTLGNDDARRVGQLDSAADHVKFESRFESGNLRRAIQAGPNHYELIISPDINQKREHFQWFYFEVSNVQPNVAYTFEVINCLKTTSMFSRGMQPVMFSVGESLAGRPGWVRAGNQVCYYRNLYTTSMENDETDKEQKGKKTKDRCFFSIRFTITFRHLGDVCYIAYHFPYTHSYLKASICSFLSTSAPRTLVRSDVIGRSVAGNEINMVTVTGHGTSEEIRDREVVFFSARVHPGESNSSWMMHGVMRLLCTSHDPQIVLLRSKFIFKLIPMLNPDGVVNGSHRCSLSGMDLNRVWDKPSRFHHPEIYHAKGVVQYMVDVLNKPPFCTVDFHGHSKRSNVFMFGNNPEESWRPSDCKNKRTSGDFSLLPELLEQTAPSFSFKYCRFVIAKSKEPSARIALWRQFSLPRVYTMESTYCGFDSGKYQGYQIGTHELKEMGFRLTQAMGTLLDTLRKTKTERRIGVGSERRGNSVEDRQSAE